VPIQNFMQGIEFQNSLSKWMLQARLMNLATSAVQGASEFNMAVSSFRRRKIDRKREVYCRRN